MAPPLPTEVLARILALENEDESPIQRQVNRQRFQLVSKNWFQSVERWHELAIAGKAGLANVRRVFEGDDDYADACGVVGPRVRALYFSVEARDQGKVAEVIGRTPKLERLEIAAKPSGSIKTLGKFLPAKLAMLGEMREFKLDGVGATAESLPVFVPKWTKLESFTLNNSLVKLKSTSPTAPLPFTTLFSQTTRLHTLTFNILALNRVITQLNTQLPSTVTNLALPSDSFDVFNSPRYPPVCSLHAFGHQLTNLHLNGLDFLLDEAAISSFSGLRSLSTTFGAVLDWPESLAGMTKLVRLRLIGDGTILRWDHDHRAGLRQRLTSAITEIVTLKSVEMDDSVWNSWSLSRQHELEEAAAHHSVRLVIRQS